MSERYDLIIIGTGAGGGTLLHRLAPSGLKILVLERGEFLPRERENWDQREVFTNRRYQTDETWLDGDGNPFRPYTHYWVGGNTEVYGAALLRLRESDFGEVRHIGDLFPAWPISYDDLEPYYTEAERLYCVHGQAGSDPCEPRRESPYPYPAVPMEPCMARLCEDLCQHGLRTFPCALGVRLGEGLPGPRAPRILSNFDGYPDLTEAKADSEVVCVARAIHHANVKILIGARADRLETDATGHNARAVIVQRSGYMERYEADLVVVACGAINSAALLLRSACWHYPRGLANSSGLVGRNYMRHQNGLLIALTDEPSSSQFQKAFAITDFYHGDATCPMPMGTVQLMGKPDADFLASSIGEHLPHVPREDLWRHTVDFFLTAEDLPHPDNRVTLTPDGQIQLHCRDVYAEAYNRLLARFTPLLDAALGRRSGKTADRLILTPSAIPGETFDITIFAINGPISEVASNQIWVREACAEVFANPHVVTPETVSATLERLDPRLDDILPIATPVERIATGFIFTEGPVWDRRDGSLLFSGPNANTIYRWRPHGSVPVERYPSGYDGADVAEYRQPGSNDLTFDLQGRLTINQHGLRRVIHIEPDGTHTVLADRHLGQRLNSPNDLIYRSDGALYFTDPSAYRASTTIPPRRCHTPASIDSTLAACASSQLSTKSKRPLLQQQGDHTLRR